MSEKTNKKIRFLETQIQIKDIIIQQLTGHCIENKIILPAQLKSAIEQLYGVTFNGC